MRKILLQLFQNVEAIFIGQSDVQNDHTWIPLTQVLQKLCRSGCLTNDLHIYDRINPAFKPDTDQRMIIHYNYSYHTLPIFTIVKPELLLQSNKQQGRYCSLPDF